MTPFVPDVRYRSKDGSVAISRASDGKFVLSATVTLNVRGRKVDSARAWEFETEAAARKALANMIGDLEESSR